MSEDRVKVLGVAGPQGDRSEFEVPKMRSHQEIWDELFKIGQSRDYESQMPEVIREIIRQRTIALNWVLNLSQRVKDSSDHIEALALTEEEVKLLGTLMR